MTAWGKQERAGRFGRIVATAKGAENQGFTMATKYDYVSLDLECECGEMFSPAPKDFTYLEPKSDSYHFLVEWTCGDCGDENWDEGNFLYEWLGQRSQRSPRYGVGFSLSIYRGGKNK